MSPLEIMVAKQVDIYRTYLLTNKDFERSVVPDLILTKEDLYGYLKAGLNSIKKESVSHILSHSFSIGGKPYLAAGNRNNPTIYISNAYGMPMDFVLPLVKTLSTDFFVITKRSDVYYFDESNQSIDQQVAELKDLMKLQNINQLSCIGWCSGCGVILKLAEIYPNMVKQLVLINGAYFDLLGHETQFEGNIRRLMPQIAENPKYAHLIHRILRQQNQTNQTDSEVAFADLTNSFIHSTDHTLYHLTSKPFESVDSLVRYATLINQYLKMEKVQYDQIQAKTLIITATEDFTASPERSKRLVDRLTAAEVSLHECIGNHFVLYNSNDCLKQVRHFLVHEKNDGALPA